MTLSFGFDLSLAVLTLAVAGYAIGARESFASVVAFISYGVLLALVWVRLSAVDVALTEAAIGSGVTGALLIGAAAKVGEGAVDAPRSVRGAGRLLTALFCIATTLGIATAFLSLPEKAPTLAPLAAEHLPSTGLGNPVTAVLLSYRAIDTLLESVVLVFAVVGVWTFASDRDWGGRPESPGKDRPEQPLTFLGQILPPLGILVGVHLVWTGATEPGGAFQGGTVLAAAWILVMAAGLRKPPSIEGAWLRFALIGGPALFLGVGVAGFALAKAFLAYPEGHSKAFILVIEAALTFSIAIALGLLALGAPGRKGHP
ncbi:MAG: sodium:proton antiporter [Methylocystis sp.]|nr:MAG: sodium:proton antiporter [Methylocystis sp.]